MRQIQIIYNISVHFGGIVLYNKNRSYDDPCISLRRVQNFGGEVPRKMTTWEYRKRRRKTNLRKINVRIVTAYSWLRNVSKWRASVFAVSNLPVLLSSFLKCFNAEFFRTCAWRPSH